MSKLRPICKNCTYFNMNKCKGVKPYAEPCEHYEEKHDGLPVEDTVNHPPYYNTLSGMECIDEMIVVFGEEAVANFCLCNVWKYRKRAIFKNGKEDLEKADWYMKKYIELGGKSINVQK